MFQFIVKPWFVVALGVLMTVLSALVTNYLIVQNNAEIASLQNDIMLKEQRIEQYWQNSQLLERKEEFGTLLLLLSTGVPEGQESGITAALSRYIEDIILTGNVSDSMEKELRSIASAAASPASALQQIFALVDRHRGNTINTINNLYEEKLQLEDQQRRIDEHNRVLQNIALFLHIMGLILVLSRGSWVG